MALVLLLTLWPAMVSAQVMQSQFYRIPFDALGGGGGNSTSASFITEDTVSEIATPTGEDLTSANYLTCAGYECLKETVSLTVAYAVQTTACDATSVSTPPYSVPLGQLTTGAVTTGTNRVCVRVSANAPGGEIVQIRDANGGLASNAVPADKINAVSATLVAGTAGYGVCSSNVGNGFHASSPFAGICDTSSNHAVGALTTSDQIIWSAPAFVTNAFGEMLTKAAISNVTPAHNDYQDTITITVTGTY